VAEPSPEGTPSDIVTVRNEGDVAILEFDDGKANALGNDTIDALLAALDEVDGSADAIVLAGRPGRFSAGFSTKSTGVPMPSCWPVAPGASRPGSTWGP